MNIALASLLALLLAIILSMVSHVNVGLVALALAWLVGVVLAGMKPEAVMTGFPAALFLTLTGVSLLFACAEANGTLQALAQRAVRLIHGRQRLLPLLFFVITCLLSTIGPGAIAAVALVIPLAMPIGLRAGLPPLLTALMVANGANAGNLSPVSAGGIIANTKMAEAGLGYHGGKVWLGNFLAHVLVSLAAYAFFLARSRTALGNAETAAEHDLTETAFTNAQRLTMLLLSLWVIGVLAFKLNPGLGAFVALAVLLLGKAAAESAAFKLTPWNVIVMVCGVSTLIALLEKTGGLEAFTTLLARFSQPAFVNGLMAFVTGLISTYSSTSGVVMPAFLPLAPKLVQQIGGGDALALALSINVGSALVDVSPLSTLGALCVATIKDAVASQRLFRQLFVWGLAMSVVGAMFCHLAAGWLARW